MKKIKAIHIIIRTEYDDDKLVPKQTTLIEKVKNATVNHALSSRMSFLGGRYAYTEEDGLYPILY